jgi:hypothetical protein
MPGAFLPMIGMIGSMLISSFLAPKPPKPPQAAPAPKAPDPAPMPAIPEAPKPEPEVSPEDAQANQKEAQNKRKRASSALQKTTLAEDPNASLQYKTLLGE